MKRVLRISIPLITAALVAAALIYEISRIPRVRQVRQDFKSSDQAILDRHGQIIDEVRVNPRVRRLNWVELDEVAPAFVDALLRAEDQRFFAHPGFDPIALFEATYEMAIQHHPRGASTITMQLADVIVPEASGTRGRRSLGQKLHQIVKAVALELAWSKREILEAYVNLTYYRGEIQGLSAASVGLFDKAPSALTLPEAAVIAALIRAPNATYHMVRSRACWLLESLHSAYACELLSPEHLANVEQGYRIKPTTRLAPHVGQRLSQIPELKSHSLVRSTLDRDIQWVALRALQRQIAALSSQNMSDGAVVVIENATGNVLAYVGNIGTQSQARFVDAVMARRQAGSTLKPLIYAKAFDERILTAATVLEDSPLAIAVTTGLYRPANFDRAFRDLVSVRNALASSLNIPAVRALELVGVETFVQTLHDMGFSSLERSDFYGPSLALGSADVRLLELTNAYRTLANGGVWGPARFSPDVALDEGARQVFSSEAAFIVTDILADRQARASTFGLENSLSTRFWAAVKTGTSKDMRDNWCVGFSEKYTVGVWAGNVSGQPMYNVTGVQGAAPVWQEIMNYLHRQESSQAPRTPEGVVKMPIRFTHSNEQKTEIFIRGTEPAAGDVESRTDVISKIGYPMDQSTIAMDPDIPGENHKVFIQVVAPREDQNLYLNGHRVGRARNFVPWAPHAGRYLLELRDSRGLVLDRVHFEVRGRRFALAN